MAVKARFYQEGDCINYTPSSAGTAGEVLTYGSLVGILVDTVAANVPTAIRIRGVVDVKKNSGTYSIGVPIYWDADGTDVDGNTGGCASSTYASGDPVMGVCGSAYRGNDTSCLVHLNVFPRQGITNSTAGTASTTLKNLSAAGTTLSAGEEAIIDDNFASIFKILKNAGIVA